MTVYLVYEIREDYAEGNDDLLMIASTHDKALKFIGDRELGNIYFQGRVEEVEVDTCLYGEG